MTTTTPEQAYWLWHDSEKLADACVDAENVEQGPQYWERMLSAGKQAVADRKEEAQMREDEGKWEDNGCKWPVNY